MPDSENKALRDAHDALVIELQVERVMSRWIGNPFVPYRMGLIRWLLLAIETQPVSPKLRKLIKAVREEVTELACPSTPAQDEGADGVDESAETGEGEEASGDTVVVLSLADQVLHLLKGAKDGLRLIPLRKKLGVDYQTLAPVMKDLSKQALIEKTGAGRGVTYSLAR